MPKIEKGIRLHTAGHWEARVTVHGRKYWKTFPKDTDVNQIRQWRTLKQMAAENPNPALCTALRELELQLKANTRPARWTNELLSTNGPKLDSAQITVGGIIVQLAGTTFRNDLPVYFPLKSGLTTLDERKYHLNKWAVEFGNRDRNSIVKIEVQSVLARWQKTGHADPKIKRLSHGSLNKLRTALLDFYTVMNGRNGYNPVRDVPMYLEDKTKPWDLPTYDEAIAAVNAVTHAKYPKKAGSKTQARLDVMLHTGRPAAIIMQLRPEDIHWKAGEVVWHGRKKGRGTVSETLTVTDGAIEALKRFDALNAYGTFSTSSVYKALKRACERAGVTFFNPYKLRHKFITDMANAGNDLYGIMKQAGHTNMQQTLRYCQNAGKERARAALEAAFPKKKRGA